LAALPGCASILGIDDVTPVVDSGADSARPDATTASSDDSGLEDASDGGGDSTTTEESPDSGRDTAEAQETGGEDSPTVGTPRDAGADDADDIEAGDAGADASPSGCQAGSSICSTGSTLAVCNEAGTAYAGQTCSVGCSSANGAHCLVLYPSPPIATADLTVPNVQAVAIGPGMTIFNTNDGSISGVLTRAANALNSDVEVIAGIGFHQVGTTGIWSLGDTTIASGATLRILGLNAAAIVSSGNLAVHGVIDARPADGSGNVCPEAASAGPGAGTGGVGCMSCGPGGDYGAWGNGPGGGAGYTDGPQSAGPHIEGGGAGHAGPGGAGDNGAFATSGGASYDAGGGSGGGAGAGGGGGGGGGFVTLVAGYAITIGDGTALEGVNAGGCGGWGGGGGGSGGTIVLEAPFVQLQALGTLAANGGSGGLDTNISDSDDAGSQGSPGGLGSAPATGFGYVPPSVPGSCPGVGMGGAGDLLAGGGTLACAGASGGGGGAAGYVLIQTMTGAPSLFSSEAVISPSVDSGAASFGIADVH
jgi:hypothetical protein